MSHPLNDPPFLRAELSGSCLDPKHTHSPQGELALFSSEQSDRRLRRLNIRGITLEAWDELHSRTLEIVAEELRHDWYALDRIAFKPNDVVIDIGAHVGLVNIYLAKRWPFLRIHAFEPHPGNYANCMENLRWNRISNVQLSHRAVTGDGRPVALHCTSMNTGGATAIFDMPDSEFVASVDSVTLDSVLERVLQPGQRCRLLKIDCEGMEYEVLRQCRSLNRIDYLVGEFHDGRLIADGDIADPSAFDPEALFEDCARVIGRKRMRIGFCHKEF